MSTDQKFPLSSDVSTDHSISARSSNGPSESSDPMGNGAAAWLDSFQTPSMNLAPFWHAFRRHWLLAMALGLLCAAIAGPVVWFFAWPAEYKATAYIRIDTDEPNLMPDRTTRQTNQQIYEIFKNTQLQYVKGPFVFNAALRQKAISELRCVKRERDAGKWLDEELKVSFPGESQIMEVSLKTDDPDEAAMVVGAVVDAYMEEVVGQKTKEQNAHLTLLDEQVRTRTLELNQKNKELRRLAEQLGATTEEALSVKEKNALQEFNDYRREYVRCQWLRRHAEQEQKAYKHALEELETQEIPDAEVDAYVKKSDPQARALAQELAFRRMDAIRNLSAARGSTKSGIASRTGQELQGIEQQLHELRSGAREEIRAVQRAELLDRLREATIEYISSAESEKQLKQDVESRQANLSLIGRKSADVEAQQSHIERLDTILDVLVEEQQKLGVRKASRAQRITLVQQPIAPLTQDSLPLRITVVIMASLLGLCLPVIVIVLIDVRAKRVNTTSDISKDLGLSVLGSVPVIPTRVLRRLGSPSKQNRTWQLRLTESIDGVAARLLRRAELQQARSILVTSAVAGEGKTTVATQLATSLARSGRRTVLVDFDLRRPAFDEVFGLPLEPGVSEVLRGENGLGQPVHETGTENLSIMTAGRWDRYALASLANGGAEGMLEKLRAEYEFVIIDASPVLPVADTRFLSQNVDSVILTVFRDVSQTPKVDAAREILEAFGVQIIESVVIGPSENLRAKDLGYGSQLLESA